MDIGAPFKVQSEPYTITISTKISTALHTLIARWKLDETEGSSAADSSGNNLIGTLVGDPQWLSSGGKFGGALKLDGVDDYVETNYATDLPAWTVAVWVNSPAVPSSEVPSGPLHRNKNYHINWNHSFDDFRGTAGMQVADTWYAASFGDLQANTWYHLAATYDGEEFKSYKNGILITNNSTPSGDPDTENTTLKLGRHSLYGDHFGGIIDDARIYNYALSQADITKIFTGKKLGKGANWILILVIVVIAAIAATLVIRVTKSK